MPTSQAVVATAAASKYLQQLCKHFAHKVAVTYDAHKAEVEFPFGTCRMRADGADFVMTVEAGSDGEIARLQAVLADHLERFAWREGVKVVWSPADAH